MLFDLGAGLAVGLTLIAAVVWVLAFPGSSST